MADFWLGSLRQEPAGVIWQDPDIVVDPDDVAEMRRAIDRVPEYVHCSVHKLWPASTMRDDWVYGHGRTVNGVHELGQRLEYHPQWFALGFTYTPARLLTLAAPHMAAWVFGQVDSGLSAVANQHGIPISVVPKCRPKHLHFYPREDDASWRPGLVGGQS